MTEFLKLNLSHLPKVKQTLVSQHKHEIERQSSEYCYWEEVYFGQAPENREVRTGPEVCQHGVVLHVDWVLHLHKSQLPTLFCLTVAAVTGGD